MFSTDGSPLLRINFIVLFCALSLLVASKAEAVDIRVELKESKNIIQLSGYFQNRRANLKIKRHPQSGFWIEDQDGKITREDSPMIKLTGFALMSGALNLSNSVVISRNKTGIALIGIYDIEDYLKGVLAKEVSDSWPLEALKAQAVASRSYALAVMNSKINQPFHLKSSVYDQVFAGHKNTGKNIWQAVEQTRGQILSMDGKTPLKAFFHSDCGGKTAEANSVWGEPDSKNALKKSSGTASDEECALRGSSKWSYSVSWSEMIAALAQKKLIPENLKTIRLTLLDRDPSGRVTKVFLSGKDFGKKADFNSFREALGFTKIKSALLETTSDSLGVHFSGRGFGHGAGLCQRGSRDKALSGVSAANILEHYYPKARVIQL